MNQAQASITIDAPINTVWDSLTIPAEVKKYFFNTELKTTWVVGEPLTFTGEWEGKPYQDKGTVLEFTPPHALSYSYWSEFSGEPDKPDNYQTIRYELDTSADGQGTFLLITQSNIATAEKAEHSSHNWQTVLAGLKKLLEK